MGLIAKKPSPPEANMTFDLTLGPASTHTEERRSRMLAAEWYPQSGVQLTWPHAGTDWAPMLAEVTECYVRMAYEIASRERLLIVTPEPDAVGRLLAERLPRRVVENTVLFACPTDDTWARDHGFLSVVGGRRTELFDFRFDGWGGKFPADRDNAINRRLHEAGMVRGDYAPHLDFTLEGAASKATAGALSSRRRHACSIPTATPDSAGQKSKNGCTPGWAQNASCGSTMAISTATTQTATSTRWRASVPTTR